MAVKRASRRRPAPRSSGSQSGVHSGTQVDQTPGEFEEGGEIGNLFDNMKDDTVVVVHRFDPEAGRQVLMYKLMPDEATDVEIQRLSGGGKYTTREHVRNDEGKMVFGRQRLIAISGVPRMARMPHSYDQPEPTAKPEVGTVDNKKTSIDDVLTAGILRLFTSQSEASETQAKMYQAMLARPDAPQIDWGELIKAVSPIIVTLLAKKDNGPNPMEMVTQIAAMVKESTSSTTQFKDMLETVDTVFSIKEQSVGPPADPLALFAGQLPKILEIISVEQRSKGRMPTEEEVKRRLAAPPKTSLPEGKVPVYQALLNKFAPTLVRWAQEGKDPEVMGKYLFNSIPEKYHGAVREFLLRDDAEELIYQAVSDLRAFPEWTNECFMVLAETLGIVEEEEEPAESEPEVVYEVGSDGVGVEVEKKEEVVEETTEVVEGER